MNLSYAQLRVLNLHICQGCKRRVCQCRCTDYDTDDEDGIGWDGADRKEQIDYGMAYRDRNSIGYISHRVLFSFRGNDS